MRCLGLLGLQSGADREHVIKEVLNPFKASECPDPLIYRVETQLRRQILVPLFPQKPNGQTDEMAVDYAPDVAQGGSVTACRSEFIDVPSNQACHSFGRIHNPSARKSAR